MGRSWKYHGINDGRPGVPGMTKMGITMVSYHLENDGYITHLPSGNLLHSYSKIAIEIVDLPNLKMAIFQSYLSLPKEHKWNCTLKEIGKKTWQKWLGSRLLQRGPHRKSRMEALEPRVAESFPWLGNPSIKYGKLIGKYRNMWENHGKSTINGGVNGKIIYESAMFHCHV
jgi:hypothetical protein